jgi:hypothetical protein
MREPRDVRQIGAKVVAVADGHSNERVCVARRGRRPDGGLLETADKPGVIGEQRIEVDGD